MEFPLIILLYIYFAFLLAWAILGLVGFYHLVRFGGRMFGTFFVGFIYVAGSIAIIFLSYSYLSEIDWSTQVVLFDRITLFDNLNGSPNVFK